MRCTDAMWLATCGLQKSLMESGSRTCLVHRSCFVQAGAKGVEICAERHAGVQHCFRFKLLSSVECFNRLKPIFVSKCLCSAGITYSSILSTVALALSTHNLLAVP